MSTEQLNQMSALDIFSASQETLEDAKRKSAEESRKQVNYLRMSQDGTVAVRILPLAPIVDAEGAVSLPRKGYEYPVKQLLLKIKGAGNNGKEKLIFANVCNAKHCFPNLENDLIDLYANLVYQNYADDEALCKKVKSGGFNGGLRYDSKRCMYVYDLDKRGDGLQILQLSYPQYKEVEERKLNLWEKLCKKNPKAACPISSIKDAYPLEITRTTENKKVNYSFNIDTVSDQDTLTEEELQTLLNAPRLPEVIYRYTRYHLEATVAFLKQYDETHDLDIMSMPEIKECIDQINLLLPADDTSHFMINGGKEGENAETGNSLNSLWAMYDSIEEKGLDDKSDEGAELRASIREFIEEHDLDITISRRDSNIDLLNAIEDAIASDKEKAEKEESAKEEPVKEEPVTRRPRRNEPEQETENEEEEESEEEAEPETPSSRSHNDDTNEPAIQPRRAARPVRRR